MTEDDSARAAIRAPPRSRAIPRRARPPPMSAPSRRGAKRAPRRPRVAASVPRILSIVSVVVALYFAKAFLVPLVMAALLAFILTPVVDFLQRRGVGRVLAVLLVVAAALVTGATITYILADQFVSLAVDLPTHRAEIEAKLQGLRGLGSGGLARLFDMLSDLSAGPTSDATVAVAAGGGELESALGLIEGGLGWIAAAFVVVLLAVFTLMRREDVRNRALRLLGHRRLTGATRATIEGGRRISRLLLLQLAINVGFGALFGIGLAVMGVPYWFLWGVGASVLRFIPYVGVLIAAAGPALVAVATTPGWTVPAGVFGYVIAIDLIVGNVVEPFLFSKHTGVSPLALLVAALFWTWLWGPIGLVLSTPRTICLVVLGQHAPRFRFLATLLGDEPALSPPASYYQRLLARDEREALAVASAHAAAHSPAVTFDEVLVPALRRIRRDRQREGVDASHETYVLDATARAVIHLELPVLAAPSSQPVLGCPAHHRAEEIALAMLATLCAPHGVRVEVSSSHALAAELEARIARDQPVLVVIAVVPPGGLTQAAFLCRRLRCSSPTLTILVAYLRPPKNFDALLVRMKKAGASYVTTSLGQTAGRIEDLLRPVPAVAA